MNESKQVEKEKITLSNTALGFLIWGALLVFGSPVVAIITFVLWGWAGIAFQFAQRAF